MKHSLWALGLAVVLGVSGGAAPMRAQEIAGIDERVLTVTGRGSTLVETAITTIRLGVEVSGANAEQVQAEVAERSNRVIEELRNQNVDRLQTAGISLFPEYDGSSRDRDRPRSMRGRNTVQFEVPVDRAGEILDLAVASGAGQIQSVTFRPTEEVLEAGRKAALELAVADARSQADVVLGALNFQVQSIRNIQIGGSTAPEPVPFEGLALARSSAPTPVVGGEQTVSAQVTLAISY